MGPESAYLVVDIVGGLKAEDGLGPCMNLVQVLGRVQMVEERQIFGKPDPGQLAYHVVVAAPGSLFPEDLAML